MECKTNNNKEWKEEVTVVPEQRSKFGEALIQNNKSVIYRTIVEVEVIRRKKET